MLMEHYVTIFDSNFLPQGLALHLSMKRVAGPFTLWIVCVDDKAFDVLSGLDLPGVRLLDLGSCETSELRAVKADRSRAEYCWTLTPFAADFVFAAEPAAQRVTYIDADLWFRKHPRAIFSEFEASGKAVLITDHGYAPDNDQSASSGQYCVQFVVFKRSGGEQVSQWWQARCLEWCFARVEDGKFGDQKYLDDWPDRFKQQVHVLENKELALAPWNAERFPYGNAVFWHFHSLRITRGYTGKFRAQFGEYRIPKPAIRNVYLPYVDDLRAAVAKLESTGYQVKGQQNRVAGNTLLTHWRRFRKHIQLFNWQSWARL
jgi:hypothetical protein